MTSRFSTRAHRAAWLVALTVCVSGLPIGAADAAQASTRPVGTLPVLRYQRCGSAGDSRSGTWNVFRSGTLTCAQARDVLTVLFSPLRRPTCRPTGDALRGTRHCPAAGRAARWRWAS